MTTGTMPNPSRRGLIPKVNRGVPLIGSDPDAPQDEAQHHHQQGLDHGPAPQERERR